MEIRYNGGSIVSRRRFSLRSKQNRYKKNDGYQDLPAHVVHFIQNFVIQSYGYPAKLRKPGYTYAELRTENCELAAKLGNTEEERESNFAGLLKDVDDICSMAFDKIQRLLCDKRKYVIGEQGEDATTGFLLYDFVLPQDENDMSVNPSSKSQKPSSSEFFRRSQSPSDLRHSPTPDSEYTG
ncbi:hypothetical protein B9Z55_014660 [Caenorhabditis nigoni]|uniref:Uncharacterized protein n=1 Tax=Caenorhabditis nigoni TaxID=1611254 RepID=A0A2G5U6S7_9PELO|nr:hypothetical protein B9Z55_014660 [Caenorhabditis nigoni]